MATPAVFNEGPMARSSTGALASISAKDETADDDVVACADETPCADVGQSAFVSRVQIVDLDQGPCRSQLFLPLMIAV